MTPILYYSNYAELLIIKRGVSNKPRAMAIYLSYKLTEDKLQVIAQNFSIKSYWAVSKMYHRYSNKLLDDKDLAIECNKLEQETLLRFSAMSHVQT